MTNLHPLADGQIRVLIEQLVSEHRGKSWQVKEFTDMNEFSSHPSGILTDGSYPVFVKFSKAVNGLEQFELEMKGLRLLFELSGVLTPVPIGSIPVVGGAVMVLEGIHEVERTHKHWHEIGHTLARIHQVKGSRFGLETHNYFGPYYQDNRLMDDWPSFYAERRLWPRLMGAINSGHMPSELIRDIEKLILRLSEICGPGVPPTLLHGDAQQNNFISTDMGAVVIDPAVYYGHPEMDLAYLDYFRPVSDDVLIGYREVMPVDPGFAERRDLWRVYGYLACVEMDGVAYLPQLTHAVRRYL